MQHLKLKSSHKPVKDYYAALGQFGQLNIDHEMAVRSAFGNLLDKCARQFEWTLVPEYSIERPKAMPLRVDGALLDAFRLRRGLWEAKDERDDLEKEAKRKISAGYPTENIIFQAPERAVLFQNGVRISGRRLEKSSTAASHSSCCGTRYSKKWRSSSTRLSGLEISSLSPWRGQGTDREGAAEESGVRTQLRCLLVRPKRWRSSRVLVLRGGRYPESDPDLY